MNPTLSCGSFLPLEIVKHKMRATGRDVLQGAMKQLVVGYPDSLVTFLL